MSQIFCSLPEPCPLARSFLLHGQIASTCDPLPVDVHQDGSNPLEKGFFVEERSYDPGPSFEFIVDPLHQVCRFKSLPMLFWECRVTPKPGETEAGER